jgi:hypothetical protein
VLICAGIGAILAAMWSQARSSRVVMPTPAPGVRGARPLR